MFFCGAAWRIKTKEKKVFLTFDDGPVPEVTPCVINLLKQYNAVATFFCVGDNVRKYPVVFRLIRESGMKVGNHTFSHCKAWSKTKAEYLNDVKKCSNYAESNCFRPPHGQMYPWWIRSLKKSFGRIVMWDILSLDYDPMLTPDEVVENVTANLRKGSIIVFHDSLKAWDRLKVALPRVLEHLKNEGYTTEIIE
jgi:peptidoglycan/xylan/chitin deacetylase (PgdA/CDA1 family)